MQRTEDEKPRQQGATAQLHLDDVPDDRARTIRPDSESVKSVEPARRFETKPDRFARDPGFHVIPNGAVAAS